MSVHEVFEEGPPCAARIVDGALRMSAAGATWGLFAGSDDSLKEGYKGIPRALYVAKTAGRHGVLWGSCAGTYFGLTCGLERLRRKRDWANATIAGAAAGAVVAAKTGSASRILASSALLSACATALDYLYPFQYPPTGV